MKRIRPFALFAGILLPFAAGARSVSADEAATAAARWLARTPYPAGTAIAATPVERVRTVRGEDGTALYHVAAMEGGGTVVLSADTRVPPVVAFRDADDAESSDDDPLYAILEADLTARTAAFRQMRGAKAGNGEGAPFPGAEKAWASLLGEAPAKRSLPSVPDVWVAPLVPLDWNQESDAANRCTPSNYPCGCVALAGAQIARFWRFPDSPRPQVTRVCRLLGAYQSFTSIGGSYDWDEMPETFFPAGGLSESQRNEIGKLCYDMGVATCMNWMPGGSSTSLEQLEGAFTTVFGYTNSQTFAKSEGFSADDIERIVFANLDAGCPVALAILTEGGVSSGIFDNGSGHAVVADGYGRAEGTLYTHLKTGWGGGWDVWYALPDVPPYSILYAAVYNVFPEKTGDLLTGRVVDKRGIPVRGADIRATTDDGSGAVQAATDARGVYALWVEGDRTWAVTASFAGATGTVSVAVPASVSMRVAGNAWGNDFVLDIAVPPPAPDDVSATKGTDGERVSVTWTASIGASSYSVWRSGVGDEPATELGTTAGTSFDDTTTDPGAHHWYWVRAENDAGAGPFGGPAEGWRKLLAPPLPTGIAASQGTYTNMVLVTWDPAERAESYVVLRAETPDGAKATIGSPTDTSFADTNAVAGQTYYYWVLASNEAGTRYDVGFYRMASGWRRRNPPAPPTDVTASQGEYEEVVVVTWTFPTNAIERTVYAVLRSPDGSEPWTELGTTLDWRYWDETVSPGSSYCYRVVATNGLGRSAPSEPAIGYPVPPPGNDDFANAFVLSGSSGSTNGTNRAATTEAGEAPPSATPSAGRSVWWTWRAPLHGLAQFSVEGVAGAAAIAVYAGDAVDAAMEIASGAAETGRVAAATFRAAPGATYRIAVTGRSSLSGDFVLSWHSGISPVHRFYSKNYKGHFFTIDEEEMRTVRDTNPNWKYERIAYLAFTNEVPGTVPLYRFWSKGYRAHFYTIDEEEMRTVRDTNPNWKYEGVAYWVDPESVPGSVPVFRFWSKGYRHHFYTIDEAEKDNLIATNPNWKYEGIAFYALPATEIAEEDGLAAAPADDMVESRAAGRTPKANDGCGMMHEEWGLCVESETDGRNIAIAARGVTDVGGVLVETRGEAPDATEFVFHTEGAELVSSAGGAGEQSNPEMGIRHFRLALPSGVWNASLWSARDGIVADEAAEGAFSFDLPTTDVWHWLRVRGAADGSADGFSLWLRAE